MKIKNIFLALLAMFLVIGCDDDDDKNNQEFSDLTVEEHKKNLEESGGAVVDKLEPMADMEAVHVINDFILLMETTYEGGDDVAYVLQPVAGLSDGADAAFNLKSSTEEPQTFSQLFNEQSGVYTFDSSTESWEKEESDEELTFHFPTQGSEDNDATLSFTNFSAIENPNEEMSVEFPELMQSVDGTLSVDDQEMITLELRGSYNDDGLPTELSENLTLQDYDVTTTFTRNSSDVSYEQSFSYQDEAVITSWFSLAGEFDYNTLEYYAENEVPFEQQELITDANVEVTIEDFKFEGLADWAAIQEELSSMMEDGDEDEMDDNFMELVADILNENVVLYIRYADNNDIVAMSEFYVTENEDEFAELEDLLDMRMVFEDGSAMDDSFFEGFDQLVTRINDLVAEVEDNYGLNQ